MRIVASMLALAVLVIAAYLGAIWFELRGDIETSGSPVAVARDPGPERSNESAAKQILFGDLHVHTTFSLDAFLHSLPLMQGEGAHPPADACDFARFCSALDFFSLNDHAESLSPRHWRESREAVRQCNAIAGDSANPDLVAFLGWEWTQMGATPADHYGHKNVILRDIADDRVPARPIAARGRAFDAMRGTAGRALGVVMTVTDFANRQRVFDFGAFRRQLRGVPVCPEGVDVRALPDDCAEATATPRGLFEKLDQWGFPALVIPHGNAWGNTTPAGISWDKQLANGNHDPNRQTLIEVYSGHGNSETYRPWRHVTSEADGSTGCPAPSSGFTPQCWRAGELIRGRCLAAGEGDAACAQRAATARDHFLAAGEAGRFVVPAQSGPDWLDSGQCTDCFQPAFNYRPGGSTQYALATSGDTSRGQAERFRFGLIASSDTHFARPATGYKEFTPDGMTDAWAARAQQTRRWVEPHEDDPRAESIPIDPSQLILLPGGDTERTASFYYTGGLVAVHANGRDRGAIWDALVRKEVYGTSGPRILLWFDLLNAPGRAAPSAPRPMGSEIAMSEPPRFRVRAAGALQQKPGCPDSAAGALGAERLAALCMNECHHPGDARHRIARIEVIRIRPRGDPAEEMATLIEDPWQTIACSGEAAGCVAEFSDPDFQEAGRDTVYYVRAIQEPTPHVNGDGLRCERDLGGACTSVRLCRAGAGDDCLEDAEARAWSSPIFVDYQTAPVP
ncbi:MAG: DUF3604 domain-containing protein [Proteobacteria bacterium]|nr:DUF3604 domain-containing protein [Pseudomonadota bacterium]